MAKVINRIKAVLAERNKTGKWLAEQVNRDPATVSKWCTNAVQPDLLMLSTIAVPICHAYLSLLSLRNVNCT